MARSARAVRSGEPGAAGRARFSEDIDFSCRPRGDNLAIAVSLLEQAAGLVADDTGVAIDVREAVHSPGQEQIEILLHYSRGGVRRQALPAVRVHLTLDEPVLVPAQDAALRRSQVVSRSGVQPAGSRGREVAALLQQQDKWPRPRDLYDLWYILCKRSEPVAGRELRSLFERKCEVRRIQPDVSGLTWEALKEWNRRAWSTQLAPMMKAAPDYERVWDDWVRTSATLL